MADEKQNIRISFVIPAYNEENYLGDCLRSIFREACGKKMNMEIIVVNNNSTDRTRKIAESFPEVIIVDEFEKGLVNARRAGFNVSTGDLIANIDADTRLTSGWIEKVLNEFVSDPKVVAYSGPYIFYDLSFKLKIIVRFFYYFAFLSYIINRYILHIGSLLQGGNFVFRKSAFLRAGGYNSNFTYWGEDADVAKRLSKVGRVVFSFKLPIYASARRLKSEGMLYIGIKYIVNYIWVILFKKPFSEAYKDIRNK